MTDWRRGAEGILEALADARTAGVHADVVAWEPARTHEPDTEPETPVPVPPRKALDAELLDQLGQPAALARIVEAGITAELAEEVLGSSTEAKIAGEVLDYVAGHRARHGTLPNTEVILHHLDHEPFGLPSFETGEFLLEFRNREIRVRGARAFKEAARVWFKDPDNALRILDQLSREVEQRSRGDDGLVVTSLANVVYEPVSWLWEGYLPTHSVTILSGEPGVNKSTLAFGIAAGVSNGKSGKPANALILTTEDSYPLTVVPRLRAADADMSRIFAIEKRRNGLTGHLQLPDDLPDLYQAIKRHEARLVVIDPLMGHLAGSVDSWKEQSIRRIMSELHHIADETDSAILSINHLNKSTTTNALNRVGGSMGIVAASRSVLLMGKNPDNDRQRILTSSKLNIGREPPGRVYELQLVTLETPNGPVESMRLRFVAETNLTSNELLRPERKTELEKAEDLLYEVLEEDGDAVKLEALRASADAAGIKWRNVQQARTNIGRIKNGHDEQGATTWALTSEVEV